MKKELSKISNKKLKQKVKKEKLAVQHNLLLAINSTLKSFKEINQNNADGKNNCTKQIQALSTSLAIISGSN